MAGYSRVLQTVVTIPNSLPVPQLDFGNGAVMSVSNVAANTAVINANLATVVEMCGTTDVWYKVGLTAAVSTNGSQFLAAGSLRYVYVPANTIVSLVQSTATGNVALVPAFVGV